MTLSVIFVKFTLQEFSTDGNHQVNNMTTPTKRRRDACCPHDDAFILNTFQFFLSNFFFLKDCAFTTPSSHHSRAFTAQSSRKLNSPHQTNIQHGSQGLPQARRRHCAVSSSQAFQEHASQAQASLLRSLCAVRARTRHRW